MSANFSISILGGDEFAILADGIGSPQDVDALSTKIRQTLTATRAEELLPGAGEGQLALRTSIGCSLHRPGLDGAAMMREADETMYRDKLARRRLEASKMVQPL